METVFGIETVLLQGTELYRAEAKNQETLAKYGHGTPDDWLERNLYARYSWQGVGVMLIIDLLLFGAIGAAVWAVQMLWIPITAAGIVNGIGHWWGYRNFEAPDASRNVSPWGIVIGGEELHNNHHTYPTSAKLSVKPYEFDIGWAYIRGLQALGLATVRKTPPQLKLGVIKPVADNKTLEAIIANRYEVMANFARSLRHASGTELARLKSEGVASARLAQMRLGAVKPVADDKTLEAIIANRYEVMANYARSLRLASRAEVARLKSEGAASSAKLATMLAARRWLHRDDDKIPQALKGQVAEAVAQSPYLAKLVAMREELRLLWTRTGVSAEQLVADLQAWLRKAEESGIAALQEFALRLRAVHA